MAEEVIFRQLRNERSSARTLNALPSECPICHVHSVPVRIEARHTIRDEREQLQIVFQCVNRDCEKVFITNYQEDNRVSGQFHMGESQPMTVKTETFHDEIAKVSPLFVKIYNQAMASEAYDLDQLTGIGLRKALEFLMKDFATAQHADKADEIQRAGLGHVITTYIDDPRIKQAATLGTWLANDETHYLRKWEDKDIHDVKVLTRLTVNWIENVLLTEKYVQDMTPEAEST